MDGILSAGASILFGGSGRPIPATVVQRVPRARDYDRPPSPPPPPERAADATNRRPKITRMSMMGRPVRERHLCSRWTNTARACRTDHPPSPHRPRPARTRTVPDCSDLFWSFAFTIATLTPNTTSTYTHRPNDTCPRLHTTVCFVCPSRFTRHRPRPFVFHTIAVYVIAVE